MTDEVRIIDFSLEYFINLTVLLQIFFVKIALDVSDPSFQTSLIGKKSIMEVTIINDDGNNEYINTFKTATFPIFSEHND